MSSSRIPLRLKSISTSSLNKMILYSSSAVILATGFYGYHSTQSSAKVIASQNNINEVASYSQNELFYDHASSANNNERFQRITIPSGKASVINYDSIHQHNDLKHVLITIQGEGEVQYLPQHINQNDEKVIYGTNHNEIVHKQLRLGKSVGIPSTNWHQIINKHESQDLVLVVTSLPSNDHANKSQHISNDNPPEYIL